MHASSIDLSVTLAGLGKGDRSRLQLLPLFQLKIHGGECTGCRVLVIALQTVSAGACRTLTAHPAGLDRVGSTRPKALNVRYLWDRTVGLPLAVLLVRPVNR